MIDISKAVDKLSSTSAVGMPLDRDKIMSFLMHKAVSVESPTL